MAALPSRRALVLVLVLGCSGEQKRDPKADIDVGIESYLRAAEKADATKTHASGDHLIATQERDRHQGELVERCKKGKRPEILSKIAAVRAAAQEERDEVQHRMNMLQVVGRGHSPDEKRFLDEEGPAQIRKLKFRIGSLNDLENELRGCVIEDK